VLGVAFSPDGKLLATTSADQTLRLWDTATGKPHGERLTGHTDTVNRVAFSPDGALLATASSDRTLRLWDTATGKPHGPPLTGHADRVIGVAFSPDGSRLATSGTDGTVRLWNPSFDSWVDVGCTMVSRNLSLSEWNDVAPGLPYERTCPDLPAGEDAPPDPEAAVYDRGTTHSAQPRPVR
jgi:WD40 repeat protein